MATFYEALKHKNRISMSLLKRPDVYGVGVGYANPNKPASGAGINVYTRKNIAATSVQNLKMLMAAVGTNVPVRFIGSSKFRANAAASKPKLVRPTLFNRRVRPVPGGTSIGKVDPFSTGTGGLVVIKNNQLYILSNNHVIVKNNSTAFAETVQPGPADAGRSGTDRIGRLFQFVPLRPAGVNFQDSAISIPTSNSLLNPRYLVSSSGALITLSGHLTSYPVGLQLMKSGRTTGFVRGTVEANNADVNVNYGGTLGTIMFRNQSIIRGNVGAVSLPGDSGSVWLRSDRFAAALNFAGSENGRVSISNPLGVIMSTYGVRVAVPAAGGRFRAGAIRGAAQKGNFAYVQPLTRAERKRTRAIFAKPSQ
ncbi:S1 family peptidase [Paenibacillus sedimenti]|nr:S1 family peptidase [Paenibacillus sedimenti]